jgi:hypothetical protein
MLAELSAGHACKAVNQHDQKDFFRVKMFGNANALLGHEDVNEIEAFEETAA